MSLQGFYTNKGSALAAKIAAGTAALTVTRVVAGSGHTADPASATSLPDIQQTLAVGSPTVSGNTATLPVTLAEVQAGSSYSLTELGVYATDPDAGEILFQIYQLDTSAPITAGGENVLRFYLRQTIGAQGVTVTCSPAGLLLDRDLDPLRNKVLATGSSSRTETMRAAELPAFLNALPRLLTESLELNVTGTTDALINLHNFYGSGSIRINGGDAASTSFLNGVEVTNCSIAINIWNCTIYPNSTSCVSIKNSCLTLQTCSLVGNGNSRGIGAGTGSMVTAENCDYINHSIAVFAGRMTLISITDEGSHTYQNNVTGAYVWYGGVILLCYRTPDLLGGAANTKDGGVIAKANGTLL